VPTGLITCLDYGVKKSPGVEAGLSLRFPSVCRSNATINLNRVPMVTGDRVLVQLPAGAGELTRGRIVFRYHERR
jgi:hypothetical protein